MVDTLFVALACGFQLHVHADDPVGSDADCLDQRTAYEAVGAGNHIEGETVVFKIIEHLKHGLVETLAIGHPCKAVRRLGCICFHIVVELGKRHSCVGCRRRLCVLHIEMIRKLGSVSDKVSDLKGGFLHIGRSPVLVVWVIQHTVFQKVVFEVRRIQFADESAVHIECGNPVRRLYVITG